MFGKEGFEEHYLFKMNSTPKKRVTGSRFIPVRSPPPRQSIDYLSPTKSKSLMYSTPPRAKRAAFALESQVASPRLQSKPRKIESMAYRTLEVPELEDDYYLDVLDWSANDTVAVAVHDTVHVWKGGRNKDDPLAKLFDIENIGISSVRWSKTNPSILAVGTQSGEIILWDTVKACVKERYMKHGSRVGAIDWCSDSQQLLSGSKDCSICIHDTRVFIRPTLAINAHKQEICGVKWGMDSDQQFISGGNDNRALIWDSRNLESAKVALEGHNAAVKALAWSPHQRGIVATGGGTADRCIRIWNTHKDAEMQKCVDTDAQVCGLSWSRNSNELVSTHGYSLNHIMVWKCPTLEPISTLPGHSTRVLYHCMTFVHVYMTNGILALSPDSSSIVTGAGDEKICFWNVFPQGKTRRRYSSLTQRNLIR